MNFIWCPYVSRHFEAQLTTNSSKKLWQFSTSFDIFYANKPSVLVLIKPQIGDFKNQ